MSISSLPNEVLILIFPHLAPGDFLALVRTNRALYDLRNEHTFWRHRALVDFRIPPQPLFENDGERWQWLYKHLQTQSEVYTWGNDNHGNLGRTRAEEPEILDGWPRPMRGLDTVGKIVDVQCGGWSTVFLNSHGKLFAAGVVNGERARQWASHRDSENPIFTVTMPLRPERKWLLDISHRTVNSFSMGRSRLLALTDHGEVIEWRINFTVAGDILSADHLHPAVDYDKEPEASMVVAGWTHGSAFYPGKGLYYWRNIAATAIVNGRINRILQTPEGTGRDIPIRIPGTGSSEKVEGSLEERMGNVKRYIVLSHHIIMLTDLDRLFSWRTADQGDETGGATDIINTEPTELTKFYPPGSAKILDVQGSFQTFGVFSSDGSIYICKLAEDDLMNTPNYVGETPVMSQPNPEIKPALQGAGVIQLAFGDWHYHALHLTGEVSSYGNDTQGCGALGFGQDVTSLLRGVSSSSHELELNPHCTTRRTVWFDPEKFKFMAIMLDKFERLVRNDQLFRSTISSKSREFGEVYSEWFEQEGSEWDAGPLPMGQESKNTEVAKSDAKKKELPSYFPLRIAAAGWSSAAVVLIDKDKAEQTRKRYLCPEEQKNAVESKKLKGEDVEGQHVSWSDWLKNLAHRLRTTRLGEAVGWIEALQFDELDQWVWAQQEFPRLRLSDGDDSLLQDGERPTRWKYGEPAWIQPSAGSSGRGRT